LAEKVSFVCCRRQETTSQAVARIADRTASLYVWGHVTSSVTLQCDSLYAILYWWSFGIGTKPVSLIVSEIANVKCNAMVDVTLIRPLNKGQGHSFWVPIDFSYTTYRLPIVTFSLGRTV